MNLIEIGEKAKIASREVAKLATEEKNAVLRACADALLANKDSIIAANDRDITRGREKGMPENLQDRLMLSDDRIKGMAEGLLEMIELADPVGEVLSETKRPNGIIIEKKRVPIGVVGIIYEARPNVTSDAFGLCFKAGNAVVLKGGSDAIESNIAIVSIMRNAIKKCGVNPDALLLIEDTSREAARDFMKLNGYIDVLIPRGSAGLIKTVVENSTVPVIETGSGNCHIYVDKSADIEMAKSILVNAKTQRNSVCNACESLLVNKEISEDALPVLVAALAEHNVELRCDEKAYEILEGKVSENLLLQGTEEDWETEFLGSIISINIVENVDAAISHINKYNTGHSETIVTSDEKNAEKFLNEVDAACVYVNASTRFTDGFEFGFGGEIGISTQKLHARGPMGLPELTSYKYVIRGTGQTRK